MGVRFIPRGHQMWPEQASSLTPDQVVKMYNDGFVGAWYDPEARAAFRDYIIQTGGVTDGSDIAHTASWADSGAGKLVIPFVFADRTFPNCWPGAAQERGDCVSHSTKNAALLTAICEIVAARPDEVTGNIEGVPVLPPLGITEGAFSTEWIYWWRGYNGDGWSCDTAVEMILKHGILLRQPYPELGIDLTQYSGGLAGKFGSSAPPASMDSVGQQHLIRTATELGSFEELRDFLHNGYGISSCGGEGFSSTRDENGVSKRQGGWSHAFGYIGADDRDTTKAKYNGPLVLCQNSWAKWNGGPRTIMGTQTQIPEGAWWARWADVSRRYMVALSSVNGWPAQKMPDFLVI